MFHIIYKTTNKVNQKIYIGYHFQTSDPYSFDGYLGSGTALIKAIKKYGVESFMRETIFVFEDESSALSKEKDIVNEVFIKRTDVYNLTVGGGLPPSHKGIPKSEDHKKKIGNSQLGKVISDSQRKNIGAALTGKSRGPRTAKTCDAISKSLTGIKHTETRKLNMKNNQPDRSGNKNSMFGKVGELNPNLGRKNTSATRILMQEAALASQSVVACPHCQTSGKRSGMQRWHFDNCRSKVD